MHAAILSTAETGEQRERCLGVENVPFSVHKAYQRIRGKQGMEDETTMRACQAKWKQKVSLEMKIFGWRLLRRRLVTRVFWKKMYPDALEECVLY